MGESQGSISVVAYGGNNTSRAIDIATACNAHDETGRRDFGSETFIAMHETGQGYWKDEDIAGTLRAEGENRPSRPSNVVAIGIDSEQNAVEDGMGTLRAHKSGGAELYVAYGISNQPTPKYGEDIQPTLDAKQNGGGRMECVAFTQNTRDEVRKIGEDGQVAGALGAEPGAHQQTYIAFQPRYFTRDNKTGNADSVSGEIVPPLRASSQSGDSENMIAGTWEMSHADEVIRENEKEIAPTLQKRMGTGGNQVPMVGVRRLTPTECERLQGFPDGWTKYSTILFDDIEKEQSDSTRYRQLGNAVAVPVVEWIAKRIMSIM